MERFRKHLFKRGLVIGKFYPPHRGHKYLIDTARSQCEQLTVILCWTRQETIHGNLRASWLRKIHPDIDIKVIEDNKLAADDSEGWARFALDILGYVPDAVFTSESYGDPFASFMGSTHVLVDRDRTYIPISATMVRSNPLQYAKFLEPCVRSYFARRVVVLGAESTGTTTLAKSLAEHYQTVWVPEYGRMYSEGKLKAGEEGTWRSEEFLHIAQSQDALEDAMAESSNGLVICDTDSFATGIWHERYMGSRSSAVEELASRRRYDLYIVTGDEIPFVQDGTRDGEHIRHEMHKKFLARLTEENKPFIVVTGSLKERLEASVELIDKILISQ